MNGADTILTWASFCTSFLFALVILVVGVTSVRSVSPRAGYMLAAGAGMELAMSCCFRAEEYAFRFVGYQTLGPILSALGMLENLVFYGLIIGSAVVLASAVVAKQGQTGDASGAPGA